MPDIQQLPVRADRHHRRPSRDRHLGLRCQVAGVGIHHEGCDLVFVLRANVQRIRHILSSLGAQHAERLRHSIMPYAKTKTAAPQPWPALLSADPGDRTAEPSTIFSLFRSLRPLAKKTWLGPPVAFSG